VRNAILLGGVERVALEIVPQFDPLNSSNWTIPITTPPSQVEQELAARVNSINKYRLVYAGAKQYIADLPYDEEKQGQVLFHSLMFLGSIEMGGIGGSAEGGGTITLLHGPGRYTAIEMIENESINIERLAHHQVGKSWSGLYTTTQDETAQFFSVATFGSGRAGGPAVVSMEFPKDPLMNFLRSKGIAFEAPVERMPGMTETRIPLEHLEKFSNLRPRYKIHWTPKDK
jgi:hypothetical protein